MNHPRLILLFLVIVSCNKPSPSSNPPGTTNPPGTAQDTTKPPVILPDTSLTAGVYVTGDTLNSYDLPKAVYWKNGSVIGLTNNSSSSGTGIAISNDTLYISCSGIFLGNNVTYWKNRIGLNLTDPSLTYPTGSALALSGTDIYVAGIAYINGGEKIIPVYWKNTDKAIHIATPTFSASTVKAIAVSENDVYISGQSFDAPLNNGYAATYWKNGEPVYLHTTNQTYHTSIANSIVVSGPDIYVAGNSDTSINPGANTILAVYWKNGVPTKLSTNVESNANSIFLLGNDVYVAGAIFGNDGLSRATYWKNGVAINLDPEFSIAQAIMVDGPDVYVVGNHGIDRAVCWKNGTPIDLGRGHAYAIAIKH